MLSLDNPIGPILGVHVYRDHADSNQFYYVSERPRLAMNGDEPEFIFIKYARDITDNPTFSAEQRDAIGGGILAFTVDLSIDQDILEQVRARLMQFSGGGAVALTPIPFRDGSVRLSMITDKAPEAGASATPRERNVRIFEKTWGATKPSLIGDNRATFGMQLDHEAAVAMEAALQAGVGFIGVVYDLEFLGMLPAFNVKVTAEYERIYNHFEAELALQGQISAVALQAQLAAGFQKLEEDGHIKIEVKVFTDAADAVAQAETARQWAVQQIQSDLFKTSLTPPSFMTRTSSDPLSQLTRLASTALGGPSSSNTIAGRPRPVTTAHNNAATPSTPTPNRDGGSGDNSSSTGAPAAGGSSATPETSGSAGPDGAPASATNSEGQDHVANATSDASDEPAAPDDAAGTSSGERPAASSTESAAGSSPSPFKIGLSLRYFRQEERKTRVYEFDRQQAVKRTIAPQGLFTTVIDGRDLSDRILEVRLDDDFFKRLMLDVQPVTQWAHEGIDTLSVSVAYPGGRPVEEADSVTGTTFSEANADKWHYERWLNDDKDQSYWSRTDVHFRSDSEWEGRDSVIRGAWVRRHARPLIVNALDSVTLHPVRVEADGSVDFSRIRQVLVELEYADGTGWSTQKIIALNSTTPSATWKLRLSTDQRMYRYRVTWFFVDDQQVQEPWATQSAPELVLSSPFSGKRMVRLIPTFRAEDLIEATVDGSYVESSTGFRAGFLHVFTPDTLRGTTLEFDGLDTEFGRLELRTTIVRSDMSVDEQEVVVVEENRKAVVVGDTDQTVRKLEVALLADASMLTNDWGVEVEIREASGDLESLTFLPTEVDASGRTTRRLWILADESGGLNYSWRRLRHRKDGTTDASEWTAAADDTLNISVSG